MLAVDLRRIQLRGCWRRGWQLAQHLACQPRRIPLQLVSWHFGRIAARSRQQAGSAKAFNERSERKADSANAAPMARSQEPATKLAIGRIFSV